MSNSKIKITTSPIRSGDRQGVGVRFTVQHNGPIPEHTSLYLNWAGEKAI